MAEFSDNQFSWVNWLTVTAKIPLADATLYSNSFMNYGADSVQDLLDAVGLDGNFLTSTSFGLKTGHVTKIRQALKALSPRINEATHAPPVEVIGQVNVSSGASILLPGKQGHHDVIRKVALASAEGATDSLRCEYAVYGRLAAIDLSNNHFPRIYGLEENFPLPSNLQSSKTGTTGLAMVMELGIANFFDFVEDRKNGSNVVNFYAAHPHRTNGVDCRAHN